MMKAIVNHRMVVLVLVAVVLVVVEGRGKVLEADGGGSFCLSWRVAVEANNARGWRTAPAQCWRHIESYMVGGQYSRDLALVTDHIYSYLDTIPLTQSTSSRANDDDTKMNAWILDVDDTCISNLVYYRAKRFGCEPYDPVGFREWAMRGECEAIPGVLDLFKTLLQMGFKVILLTGRDESTLGEATTENLLTQGFVGYHRLIFRTDEYKGKSAVEFKSEMRKQLEEEGYRIWGNVGDQWTDLQGDCTGNRTFKLPNPMYFVP